VSTAGAGLLLVMTARIPVAGVAAFRDYEAAVLPLLAEHGGMLQRRLRNADGTVEVHLVSFTSQAGFDRFRKDPRRSAVVHLMTASGATAELLEVMDVE
jgi:hypothetical protein